MARFVLSLMAAVGLASCSAPRTAPSTSPGPAPAAPNPAPVPSAVAAPETRSAVSAAPATSAAPPSPDPGPSFPPPPISAPFARSARPGDGEWTPLGSADRGERVASSPHAMFTTQLHPHPVSRFKSLTVVAIDLTAVELHYVPGSADVADVANAKTQLDSVPITPGRVADEHLDDLLVIFNGGFKPRHGRWGMRVAGRTLVPPREEGCTVALFADGRVAVRSWPALVDQADAITSFRQTPPCLVEDGKLHPLLEARNERHWGGHDPKRKTRRRSAVGVDESGRILYYGLGVELEPSELARGLQFAGVADAAQLDINWSWTRFLVVGQPSPEAPLQITGTLIPEMVHQRRGYVEKAIDRDFFYVTRRQK